MRLPTKCDSPHMSVFKKLKNKIKINKKTENRKTVTKEEKDLKKKKAAEEKTGKQQKSQTDSHGHFCLSKAGPAFPSIFFPI